ncbi:ABC transporter ATP-binding protein [Beduini massiliensis]|uniref:ABC transporter ATP-binding protein n=1 Tax=Beduini massiliensis TaxID=1585974 RepID=UPI000942C0EF
MAVINVKDVSKTYGSGDIKVEALKNSSFSIERGEFVCIIGTSGSGKSTLMHMMAGVDTVTTGEIFINGKDVTKLDQEGLAIFRRREVGIIYQFFNLVPVLTARENIELPLMLDEKKVDRQYFNELVELLGIKDRLDFYPSKMSGGEQQRVAIARALIHKPSIILADEPTGNLNSKLAKEIMEFLVLASKKYNQTIVMITHDLNLARYADRVLEIQDGHIIKDFQTEGEDSPIEETSIKRLDKDEIFKRAQEKLDNMEFSVHIDEEYEKWDMKTGNFVIDYNEMLRTLFFIYNEDLKTTEDKKDEKVEDVMKVYFDLFLEGMDVFARARCIEFKNMKKNKVVKSISTKEELLQFVDTFDNARWMTTKRKKMLMKAIEEKEPTFYHEGK